MSAPVSENEIDWQPLTPQTFAALGLTDHDPGAWRTPYRPGHSSVGRRRNAPRPSSFALTPKSGTSFFELQLLICDADIINDSYSNGPASFRHLANRNATIMLYLNREKSRESSEKELFDLIIQSNPRLNGDKRCMNKVWINAYAVGAAGVRVSLAGVIAQLWGMETAGLGVAKPDLFGMGGNELQVIVRPRD